MIRRTTMKANLLAAAALAGPALVVSFGHGLIGSGPRASHGAVAADQTDTAPAVRPVTPRQAKAMARAMEVSALATVQSPFRPSPQAEAPAPAPVAQPPETPALLTRPDVHLRMILRQADGSARALINGNSWDAGDAFAEGWTIDSIDADARSVTFVSSDGQTFTVSLDTR